MLFKEINYNTYSENHMKHINRLCEQNAGNNFNDSMWYMQKSLRFKEILLMPLTSVIPKAFNGKG
jgi:hypothetical protein